MNGIRDKNFFLSFSAILVPFWLKIIPERGFLIFWIFLLFFFEIFFPKPSMNRNRGKNFFSLFLGLSTLVLAKYITGKRFFNFFAIFFGIFFPRPSMNGNRGKTFFLSFSAYLLPFWLKIIPERDFLIFLLFFSEFSCPGQVRKEFGTKIFFSISRPISSHFS